MGTSPAPRNLLTLVLLGGIASPPIAAGQSQQHSTIQRSTLIVGGEAIKPSSASGGRIGSVDWVGELKPSQVVTAGVVTFSLADAAWTYGRVGGSVPVRGRTIVRAQSDLGRGHEGAARFSYLVARLGATHQIAKRVVLDLEDQYVHINRAVGHIGKLGVVVTPSTPVTIEAAFRSSFGGSLGVNAVTARIDRRFRRRSVFGGVSLGIFRSELAGLTGTSPAQSTYQAFGGTVIPAAGGSLTLGLDALWTPHSSRSSLVAAWSVPL